MTEGKPACRRRAMDLLARREHSRRELLEKLTSRAFEPELVSEVLDELEQDGLLSAERFARSFVAARQAKGHGPRRIRAELTERGIEPVEEYLSDADFDWVALARTVRTKRFGPAPPRDLKEKARQVRFLEYRGFGHDQIRRALEFGEDSD